MRRDRGYYRRQRKRTIQRKERILGFWGNPEEVESWERGAKGRLDKGKIHCSCPLCRRKSYDEPTNRDRRSMEKAEDMISEYWRKEVTPYERKDLEQTERD